MYCKNTINLSYSRTSNEISFTQSSKSKDIRDPPKTGFLANRDTIWNRAGSSEEKGLIFDWSGEESSGEPSALCKSYLENGPLKMESAKNRSRALNWFYAWVQLPDKLDREGQASERHSQNGHEEKEQQLQLPTQKIYIF